MRTDLAGIVAKGFSLNELQEIGDAHEFESLVRQKDLASLGLSISPKHSLVLGDLFQIIYRCAPAFDVLAQSHFILTFTWGICRLLVQVSLLPFPPILINAATLWQAKHVPSNPDLSNGGISYLDAQASL